MSQQPETTDEGARRRRLFCDYLATVPEGSYDHADWVSILDDPDDDSSVALLDLHQVFDTDIPVCGTVACAAGWAAIGVKRGIVDIPRDAVENHFYLAEWLGVPASVFLPAVGIYDEPYPSRDKVIAKIRSFGI